MILDIDVGNSFVKWRALNELGATQRGSQSTRAVVREGLDLSVIDAVTYARLSSVGDASIIEILRQQIANTFDVELRMAVVSRSAGGVQCGYRSAKERGIHRWLAMVSAYSKFKRSLIVADLGSAITLDVVSDDGQHMGGYILPGLSLMRESLCRGTVQVSANDDMDDAIVPANNTSAAVNRGSLFAVIATIEKLAQKHQALLVLTGGDANLIKGVLNIDALYERDLVIDGLSVDDISLIKC
jgi:type III pantothenate kinase